MKVPSHRGRSRLKDNRRAPAACALEVEPVAADIDLLAGQRGSWERADSDAERERPRLPAPHDDRPAARARVPPHPPAPADPPAGLRAESLRLRPNIVVNDLNRAACSRRDLHCERCVIADANPVAQRDAAYDTL